ncbi:MAG TPA: hypothetical protein VI197_26535 [Polyangiaceae bacterium]
MRTRVHDSCGGIAAVLGALTLVQPSRARADESASPQAEPQAEPPLAPATTAAPSGPPPEVNAADSSWHEPSDESSVFSEAEAAPSWSPDVGLGAQLFGVGGKAMVGLSLRVGDELFWGELEFTPIWLTKTSSDFDGSFVGNQWGFYFSLAPLRTRFVEGLLGGGLDLFHLWGIHSDEAFLALSFKAAIHVRPTPSVSLFATARSYALHSGGVELGTYRNGERTIPVVGTLGSEWRFE